jgi:hypothetical protein
LEEPPPWTVMVESSSSAAGPAEGLRTCKRWIGENSERGGQGFFIIDLQYTAEIEGFEIDNTEREGSSIKSLIVFGGESKIGPWFTIYYGNDLESKADMKIDINKMGPFRFVKVIVWADENKQGTLKSFRPIFTKKTGIFI